MANILPVPSLTVAGRTFVGTELTNLKVLIANNNGSNPSYKTFRKEDGTHYQVPASKKLTIKAMRISKGNTDQNSSGICRIGYGSTAVDSSSAPTGDVTFTMEGWGLFASALPVEYAVNFKIPASQYAYNYTAVAGACSAVVIVYGIEEDA